MYALDGLDDAKGQELAENALSALLHPLVIDVERPKRDLIRGGGIEDLHIIARLPLRALVGIDGDNPILDRRGDVRDALDKHDRDLPAGPRDRDFERLRRGLWTTTNGCGGRWGIARGGI